VIKVIWGSNWDPLLARDTTGRLRQLMEECLAGTTRPSSRATARSCARSSSVAIRRRRRWWRLDRRPILGALRGGHDPMKVFTAYKAASEHRGHPSVISPRR